MPEEIEKASEEQVISELMQKDINSLTLAERSKYLWWYAVRKGLDPLSKPFDVIPAQSGKLILYANRAAAEQYRKRDNINLEIVERGLLQLGTEHRPDVYVVRTRATMPDGRFDEALGAVSIDGMKGEALANAIMKCETKAKRRVTLSIEGEGMPDETEIGSWAGPRTNTPTEPRRIEPPAQQNPSDVVDAQMTQTTTAGPTAVASAKSIPTVSWTAPATPDPPRQPAPPTAGTRKYPPAVAPVAVKP